MEHNTIGLIWVGGLMLYGMYMVLVLNANAIREYTMSDAVSAFAVRTVLAENLGLLLRSAFRLRTYTVHMNTFSIFGIEVEDASRQAVEAVRDKYLAYMRKRWWAYPASQRVCILFHATKLLKNIAAREARMREASEEFFKQKAKASQGQQQSQQKSAPKSSAQSSAWRIVLGLGANERDVNVIKRAYRTLAFKFHPDRGGSSDRMAQLNRAFAQARDELAFV